MDFLVSQVYCKFRKLCCINTFTINFRITTGGQRTIGSANKNIFIIFIMTAPLSTLTV